MSGKLNDTVNNVVRDEINWEYFSPLGRAKGICLLDLDKRQAQDGFSFLFPSFLQSTLYLFEMQRASIVVK